MVALLRDGGTQGLGQQTVQLGVDFALDGGQQSGIDKVHLVASLGEANGLGTMYDLRPPLIKVSFE
jgi:hypothetical protein